MRQFLTILSVLLSGCATVEPPPASPEPLPTVLELVNHELFSAASPVDRTGIFSLTPQQQQEFLAYFNRPQNLSTAPNQRLYDYMERFSHQFDYLGETLTADEALAQQRGNCLSLAIVTTALARLADVRVGYQLVNSAPVFERRGEFVLVGRHIRTVLHGKTVTEDGFFSRTMLVVDYFPDDTDSRLIGMVSESDYISMYYRNLGADALVEGRLADSFAFVMVALEHAPLDADSINMLALLHRKAGDLASAERLYQRGIEIADDRLTLVSNYRKLLLAGGRVDEAAVLTEQLANYDDQRPYHWLRLAHTVFDQGSFDEAKRYYSKAARLAPYLEEAHFGVARSALKLGQAVAARRSIAQALETSRSEPARRLYRAKLQMLGRSQ